MTKRSPESTDKGVKQSQSTTYFNQENKPKIVQDFIVAFLNDSIKVDFTRPATLKDFRKNGLVFDWNKVPGEHEIALLNYLDSKFNSPFRTAGLSMEGGYITLGRKWFQKAKVEKVDSSRLRIFDDDYTIMLRLNERVTDIDCFINGHDVNGLDIHPVKEDGKITIHRPVVIDDPTKLPRMPDERFGTISELIDKYTGAVLVTDETKKNAEQELYSMIITLAKEKRITGSFKLEPFRDWEIQKLHEKIENVQRQIDSTNKLAGQIIDEIRKYRGKGQIQK